jgi:hypothetical protein
LNLEHGANKYETPKGKTYVIPRNSSNSSARLKVGILKWWQDVGSLSQASLKNITGIINS